MPFLDNFICFCGNGMIESMLEPHLKDAAGATQTEVGLTFLILGGVYMATTPITGYVSLKVFWIFQYWKGNLQFIKKGLINC